MIIKTKEKHKQQTQTIAENMKQKFKNAIKEITEIPIVEKAFAEFYIIENANDCELIFPNIYLNVFVKFSNDSMLFKSKIIEFRYNFDYKFIEQNSSSLVKEVALRGLEIKTEKLLYDVLENINSAGLKKLTLENVKHTILLLLLFAQITSFALKNFCVNNEMWNKNFNTTYIEWQKYFQLKPEDAGWVDASLDEIVMLPDALLLLYMLGFNKKQFNNHPVKDVMEKLAFKNLMADKDVVLQYPDEATRTHYSIQTLFSVSFTLTGACKTFTKRYS